MGDWIGLTFFVLLVVGAVVGLSYLGRPPKKLTEEEYQQRVTEARGTMSAGVAGVMYALQKLMNPKAAEAVEVQKDFKAGFYDESDQHGDGGDGEESRGPEEPPARKRDAELKVEAEDEGKDDA